ncbi:magnesium transporter [Neorickettsia helminthoeca str. Oregon]|uniref:Magnesium transporter MgtE n=1 Tax=Neorickettsia helminthoeca str. Oregon TaxID=1286528 RepID=X5GWE4_9RICK|nr:magnesium transporter [Neorickettsia helminthoeca]AHX11382.1 magnesium transporter [Neorickettsia helminthoeca str. Oregon]
MIETISTILERLEQVSSEQEKIHAQRELVDAFINAKSETKREFIHQHLSEHPYVLTEISEELINEIIEMLGVRQFSKIITALPTDEIVDVLENLRQDSIKEIIDLLPSKLNRVIKEILAYPEESAGRLIHKDFIVIPKDWSIEQVLQFIRIQKKMPKYLSEIFVVDESNSPIGSVSLNDILCAKSRSLVKSIMQTKIETVGTGQDQEEVARLFREYSLRSVAVVDEEKKIVGVISIDDVVDIISEEAEEDILHAGKVSESDINASVSNTVIHRIKWLIVTFLSINFSSYVIGFFQLTLQQHVELAILMPITAAMGGNAGIQASTVAVRAIITKKLAYNNAFRLFLKELLVGLCNGVIMSAFMVMIIAMRFHNLALESTFTIAIVLVFTLATSVGAAIPFIIEKCGGDPALSSSIITSSFTDILAFVVLLSTARIVLG